MIKEILKRVFIAVGIANLVCMAITFAVYISGEDLSSFSALDSVKNQLSYSIIGAASGGAGVLFGIKKLSMLKATVIHFFILLAAFVSGYFLAWNMPDEGIRVLIPIACFVGMYVVTWSTVYLLIKRNVKKINEKLNKEA